MRHLVRWFAVIVLVIGTVILLYQMRKTPPEVETQVMVIPPPEPDPEPANPVPQITPQPEEPPPPLPALNDSDPEIIEQLTGLIGQDAIEQVLQQENIVRRIVTTVDNLPRQKAPMRVWPLRQTPGRFRTTGPEVVLVNCLPPSFVAPCLTPLAASGLAFGVYANLGAPYPNSPDQRREDCTSRNARPSPESSAQFSRRRTETYLDMLRRVL